MKSRWIATFLNCWTFTLDSAGSLRARRRDRDRQGDSELDFDALQLRLHPAASRVKLLSQANSGVDRFLRSALRRRSGPARRAISEAPARELESLLASAAPPHPSHPGNPRPSVAADWFRRFEGAGLDGVIAKPVSGAYEPNKRVMLKVKHERECDCVVAGFRWHKKGERTQRRLTAAGALRRRRRAAACRRLRQLHRREAPRTGGISRAVSQERARRPPVEGWAEADSER